MILAPSFSENDSKPNYEQTDINKPHWSDLEVSGRQELWCNMHFCAEQWQAVIPSTQLIWPIKDEALLSVTSLNQSSQFAPRDVVDREVFGPVSFPFFALFALCLNLTGRYKVIDRTCLAIKVLV